MGVAAVTKIDGALTSHNGYRERHADEIEGTSVIDRIRRSCARFSGKTAVVALRSADPDADFDTISYAELLPQILRRANYMRSIGVEPGAPVVVIGPLSIPTLLAYWAAHAAGAALPVNAFLGPKAIAEIASSAGARVIVSGPAGGACGSYALARAIMALSSHIEHHLVVAGDAGDGTDLSAAGAAEDGNTLSGPEPTLDDVGALFPTGGTTGAPKIARLSHRNLLVGALATAIITDEGDDHVVPAGLPLFHVGGGVIATTRALFLGHTLVLLTPSGFRSPEIVANFWRLAVRHRFTQVIAVPTVFADLLRAYRGEDHRIRILTAGASKMPLTLMKDYERVLGLSIHEGYGMTETSGFCAANPVGLTPRPGSGGIAAPFYRLKVARLDGERRYAGECGTRELGSVLISGPGVFQGYMDEKLTAEKFIRGVPDGEAWIDSGDLGEMDEDGYLWILGRDKDLIIRGGHNIDPAPIEDALLAHPAVLDAAVVGMPDVRVGELPIAFVQFDEAETFDADALRAHCQDRVPDKSGTPVRFVMLHELPRTAMRKIFKPELRRHAAEIAVTALVREFGGEAAITLDSRGCLRADISESAPATLKAAIESLNIKCNQPAST